jgi:hypothetical protein
MPLIGQARVQPRTGALTFAPMTATESVTPMPSSSVSVPFVIPHIIYGYIPNALNSGDVLFQLVFVTTVVFAVNFAGSLAICDVAPTADTVFHVALNGNIIGTMTIYANMNDGVFAAPTITKLVPEDILSLTITGDDPITLSGLSYTFKGSLA